MIVTFASDGPLLTRIIGPLAFIIVVAVIGGVAILIIRRRLDSDGEPNDFTLDGLERMRAAGQLTDAEFRRARNVLIDHIQQAKAKAEARDAESSDSP